MRPPLRRRATAPPRRRATAPPRHHHTTTNTTTNTTTATTVLSEGPIIPSVNPKNIRVWEGYFARFDLSQLPFAPGLNNPTVYYD